MDARDFKQSCQQIRTAMLQVIESQLFSIFHCCDDIPDNAGQYWEYRLEILDDSPELVLAETCGYFVGEGVFLNTDLDINLFFSNNDQIMRQFWELHEKNKLRGLLGALSDIEDISEEGSSPSINVYSYVKTRELWIKGVCEELVLIMHTDDDDKNRVSVSCMQSERYNIKSSLPEGFGYFRVPFDKCNRFNNPQKINRNDDEENGVRTFKYDIVLSFAGEDRAFAEGVARILVSKGVRVFYDRYEDVELWGKDLYTHLDEVYRKLGRYCVMFISENYKERLWTNHERESAQARAFEQNEEYILPVRLDDTEIPGIKGTIGYLDGTQRDAEMLSAMCYKKLHLFD